MRLDTYFFFKYDPSNAVNKMLFFRLKVPFATPRHMCACVDILCRIRNNTIQSQSTTNYINSLNNYALLLN